MNFRHRLRSVAPPNHSKIWGRFSFTHKANPGSNEFNLGDISDMFNSAQKASSLVEDLFFEKYKEYLQTDSLKKLQTILVKGVASHDDYLKKIIDDELASGEKDEKVDFKYVLERLPRWLSDNALHSFDNFKESVCCFALSTCDMNGCDQGIFLKCAAEDLTDYVSMGYTPDTRGFGEDYKKSSTHNITKALIRDISPYI